MHFVVSDVHGHRTELTAALRAAGLVDEELAWTGGDSTLWFLGDFFDRGPDGVGVVEFVMWLQRGAAKEGGAVRAVLGNHEVLALGMRKFGDRKLGSSGRSRSFAQSWLINGGQQSDQDRLTDEQVEWLSALPALAVDAGRLLMHADSVEYLDYADSLGGVNSAVAGVLGGDDLEEWWDCWVRLTARYSFAGADTGVQLARTMLRTLGGRQIVHGHTLVGDLTDTPSVLVEEPLLYADGLVLDVDGGIYDGGPCLVVPLPEQSTD